MLNSMLGGGMMFAIGALYLLFEKRILSEGSSASVDTESPTHLKSRIVLGIQVGCHANGQYMYTGANMSQLGLVLLSIVVTKSSIAHVQGRQGLPLGVLVVGWGTLGM